jgi:putative ABC transport system permease protein
MASLGEVWRRFLFLWQSIRFNRDMDEEIRFHLERRAEEHRSNGLSAGEAEQSARRRFGNVPLLEERSREAWGWSALDRLRQDVKFALRSLLRRPAFSLIVMITLACGIGVNTAVFSAVYALLLHPYPFPEADRIVSLDARNRTGDNSGAGYQDFLDWQQQNDVFEAIAITPWTGDYTLTGQGEPQLITGGGTTADFWRVLGIQPLIGRFFTVDEDRVGQPPVAILTYAAWKRRFGGDPGVVGRAMMLDGRAFTVIGVLPAKFVFPGIETCEFFTALHGNTQLGRTQHQYDVVARLKPGISVARAQADMTAIARRLELAYPETNTGWGIRVQPLRAYLAEGVRNPVLVIFAIVASVLLLACINVAGLLLARAAGRMKEMAIRAALGAGRGRIVRQLITETLLLSLLGGCGGIALSLLLMVAMRRAAPPEMALDSTLHLNPLVLSFTLAVSLATGVVAGLFPAWSASKAVPNTVLKDEGRTLSGGRSRNRLIALLVAAEVALSMVLLAGAGLMVKSVVHALHVDTGLRADEVLSFELALPAARYSNSQATKFYRDLLERLQATPGVDSAAAVTTLPMTGGLQEGAFLLDDRPKPPDWRNRMTQYSGSTPGYFRTMGIPILRGRDFNEGDTETSAPVGIINDTLARQYFDRRDPIGRRYRDDYDGQWRTIVGVVGSVAHQQPTAPPMPGVFAPQTQWASRSMWITVRARGKSAAIAGAVRTTVHRMDSNLPLMEMRTMREVFADSLSTARLFMHLLTAFALFALLLDAIGIYGMVEYAVRQRTHEMGVRLALGASRRAIFQLALRGGVRSAAVGVVLGLPVALAVSGVLRSMLYGVSPRDGLVFAGVPCVLLAVAFCAGVLPARRAATVDPVVALHYE